MMKTKRVTPKTSQRKTGVSKSGAVVLPDGPSTPSHRLLDYSFGISGMRGIGKTTTSSKWGNEQKGSNGPIHMMFEPGGKSLAIRQIPRPEDNYILDWEKFGQAIDAIGERIKEDPDYCNAIILDTGYMAYERCFEYILKKHNITDPRDKAWGSTWKIIEAEFRDMHFRILHELNVGLVVITHTEIKEITQKIGGVVTVVGERLRMQLSGQARKLYNALLDVEGYIDINHVMRIRPSEDVEAKQRISGHFLFTDGTPIELLSLGRDEDEGYKSIVAGFNNELARRPKGGTKKKSKG